MTIPLKKNIQKIQLSKYYHLKNYFLKNREEKERFYGQLEYERKLKGRNPGWTAHKYKAKFKVWPKGMSGIGDVKPDQAFSRWIHSQNIKYAKSKIYIRNSVRSQKKHE